MAQNTPQSLGGMIRHIYRGLENKRKVSIKDLQDSFGRRVYAPFLFIIGLFALSPLGAIPGAGILSGLLTILIAVQYFFTPFPWLPQKILQKKVSAKKARDYLKKSEPYFKKIDRFIKPRLYFWTEFPFNYIMMGVVVLLGISLMAVAVIPWAMTPPSLAIMLFGIAFLTHDGLIMLIGLFFFLISFVAVYFLL